MLLTLTNNAANTGMDVLMIAAGVFALILTVLWILVPFAVFGIKPLLRQLLAEQRRTNDLLTTPPVATGHVASGHVVHPADPVAPGEPVYVRRTT